jgi:cellulose synthase/poly-beta-1,6-N-acetylglucosamine synthase-like glycosyltransferase
VFQVVGSIHIAAALVCAAVFFAMSSLSNIFIDVIIVLNVVAVVVLSAYALHEGVLLVLYLWHKLAARLSRKRQATQGVEAGVMPATQLPSVTVQLPLYNERYVAERVIAAACALDYPRDLLQVQVLDDSTDDTSRIAQRAAQAGRESGVDVELVHRDNRSGYKAGALENGLRSARGELVAIFDADFIPPRNFLQRVICEHHAFDDPEIGFVQTRWAHLNEGANAVTRAQVLLLDMHFVIDQYARSSARLKMNFNGSGGVWRRAAIDAAGGWQSDTLTEDLDLSYRAQLKGWRGSYLDGELCPGELPSNVLAFKRQQARWARGSAQCLRKLSGRIIHSNLPLGQKIAAFMHVSGYVSNVFALLLALVTPLFMLLIGSRGTRNVPQWMSMLSVIGFMPVVAMFVAQAAQGNLRKFWSSLPAAIVLGVGVSLSNTVAVLKGLFDKTSGEFVRTPKSVSLPTERRAMMKRAAREKRGLGRQSYTLQTDWTLYAECVLAGYILVVCLDLAVRGDWLGVAPLLLYACGFISVVMGQIGPSIRLLWYGRQRKVGPRLESLK